MESQVGVYIIIHSMIILHCAKQNLYNPIWFHHDYHNKA